MKNRVILNTEVEPHFEVFNGKKWVRFMVSHNRRYHKDSAHDFWVVVAHGSTKEHHLNCEVAQKLYENKKMRYV